MEPVADRLRTEGMDMLRKCFSSLSFAATLGLTCMLHAQEIVRVETMDRNLHPSYEVATIKPSDPKNGSSGFHTSGHRIFIENQTVMSLVSFAYDMHNKQIVNLPEWCKTERFDIDGVPDEPGQPGTAQQQEMLRKLLEERFGLKTHTSEQTMGIYALTVARGGEKMTENTKSPDGLPDQTGDSSASQSAWRMTNNSMDDFARFLQYFLERPVVNQTDLKGKYDFLLKWSREQTQSDNGSNASTLPGLFTAMQEQLGIKVEPTRGPVKVLVVDAIDHPSRS